MNKSKIYMLELNSDELKRIHSALFVCLHMIQEWLEEDEAEYDTEEIEKDKKELYETVCLLNKICEIRIES